MATRLVSKTWKVEGVLTNVTTATYGVVDGDGVEVVADGTAMSSDETGVYYFSFEDTVDTSYVATIVFVYSGATYTFEVDLDARSAVGDMVASYSSLLERVGHFLFGIRSGYTSDQTSDIEECIKDGLHDVYAAHSWSFFRPMKEFTTTEPYETGTITVVDGVVTLSEDGTFPTWAAVGVLKVDNDYYDVDTRDGANQVTLEDTSVDADAESSYTLSRVEYDMPTGFEDVAGNELAYQPGQSDFYPTVKRRHDDEIRRRLQDDPYTDRPLYFSVRTVEFDATVGSRRRLALYPMADDAYVMKVPMLLRPTMIDEVNQYPVGTETLTQVITEACLAAAERNYDEQEGRHTKRFQELLPLAIRADMEKTSPTSLGNDAPKTETEDFISRSVRMGDVTINDTVM